VRQFNRLPVGLFLITLCCLRLQAQEADVVVNLAKVKIPEKYKSHDICPVHGELTLEGGKLWVYKENKYAGCGKDCEEQFKKDPNQYAEKVAETRWVKNFIDAMSTVWCPVTDYINPGGGIIREVDGVKWEINRHAAEFLTRDESVAAEYFKVARERLERRARESYKLTGGKYIEGAKSPIEGAMPWDEEPVNEKSADSEKINAPGESG
jgi:hypothetical protein